MSKYYWLKLDRNFFKRHDIRIVEEMPNGKDYVLFYMKLLLESIDHEGRLRFSDTIPYNENMLATITNTNIDIVRAAMKIFTELKMIEVLDDSTIFMTEVHTMIGSAANNSNAIRQQRFRDKQKAAELPQSVTKNNACVTPDVTNNNESKNKRIEIDKDKELETDILKKPQFVPPTIEEVYKYCTDRRSNINPQLFFDYYTAKDWFISAGCRMTDWKACVRAWENNQKNYDID